MAQRRGSVMMMGGPVGKRGSVMFTSQLTASFGESPASALGGNQQWVVIDIGDTLTKAGFSGEAIPRAIYHTNLGTTASLSPSAVPTPTTHTSTAADGSIKDTSSHLETTPVNTDSTPLCITQGIQTQSHQEWTQLLLKFFKDLYFRKLLVNPEDRNILICEHPYWPLVFKTALATALFELNAPGVSFTPSLPLPMYLCTKNKTALCVDVGYFETRVLPIVEGYTIDAALTSVPIGMDSVKRAFAKAMNATSVKSNSDVVLKLCTARPQELSLESYEEVEYTRSSGETSKIPGVARVGSVDSLFGDNEEKLSVAEAVCDALLLCSCDSRYKLVNNLLISGGTSMIHGFLYRLLQEIRSLMTNNPKYSPLSGLQSKLQVFESKVPAHIRVFMGASILGSLNVKHRDRLAVTTADNLEEDEVIEDWLTPHVNELRRQLREAGNEESESEEEEEEVYEQPQALYSEEEEEEDEDDDMK